MYTISMERNSYCKTYILSADQNASCLLRNPNVTACVQYLIQLIVHVTVHNYIFFSKGPSTCFGQIWI